MKCLTNSSQTPVLEQLALMQLSQCAWIPCASMASARTPARPAKAAVWGQRIAPGPETFSWRLALERVAQSALGARRSASWWLAVYPLMSDLIDAERSGAGGVLSGRASVRRPMRCARGPRRTWRRRTRRGSTRRDGMRPASTPRRQPAGTSRARPQGRQTPLPSRDARRTRA